MAAAEIDDHEPIGGDAEEEAAIDANALAVNVGAGFEVDDAGERGADPLRAANRISRHPVRHRRRKLGSGVSLVTSSPKADTLRMSENTDSTQARIKQLEERLAKLETFVDAAFGALAEGGGFSVAQQDLVNVLSDGRPNR